MKDYSEMTFKELNEEYVRLSKRLSITQRAENRHFLQERLEEIRGLVMVHHPYADKTHSDVRVSEPGFENTFMAKILGTGYTTRIKEIDFEKGKHVREIVFTLDIIRLNKNDTERKGDSSRITVLMDGDGETVKYKPGYDFKKWKDYTVEKL